jgi:L-ascorbate 6-phosphate lactonase
MTATPTASSNSNATARAASESAALVPLTPSPGQVAVRWLGQGGFAFRSPGGVVWCVDPYLSDFGGRGPVDRLAPAPVAAKLVQTDAVLCTHAHSDHVDPITLPEIAKAAPRCRFYAAAEGAAKTAGFGIAPERIQTVTVGDRGVPISALSGPAAIEVTDVHADVVYASHSGDAVGFVFYVGEGPKPLRVYITGDSLYEPALVSDATRNVDLLLVCINGRMGNMSHEEAARLSGALHVPAVVPMHFGVMPHNTIDPQLFLDALREQGVTAQPRVLQIGETALFGR